MSLEISDVRSPWRAKSGHADVAPFSHLLAQAAISRPIGIFRGIMPGLARFSKKPPKKDSNAKKIAQEEQAPTESGDNFAIDKPVLNFENFGNDGMANDDFGFLGAGFGGINDEEQEFDPFNVNFLDVGDEVRTQATTVIFVR